MKYVLTGYAELQNCETDKQFQSLEPLEHLTFYCFTLQNTTPCPSELSTVGFLGWLIPRPGILVNFLVPTLISTHSASCSLKWFPTIRVLGQHLLLLSGFWARRAQRWCPLGGHSYRHLPALPSTTLMHC